MKWILAAGLLVAPAIAHAEVVSSSANGFHVRQTVQLVVPQPNAYASFQQLPGWWNSEHTYSGDSKNLSLALNPGGCFCERIPEGGGGIEHMRVTYVDPGKRVVMTGSLGPLLFEATTGVLDVRFDRIAGGSKITLDYKVAGFADGNAAKLAPLVDSVLADQMVRYRRFARSQPKS